LTKRDEQAEKPAGSSSADVVKFAGLILFLLIVAVVGFQIVAFVRGLESTDNFVEQLTDAIREAGFWGVLICLGLQFVQVVIAIIPGEIVQAAIGLVYGTLLGGLITLTGALLSSICVFYLVRFLGAPFVQNMLGKQEGHRMEAVQRFLGNHKRLNATVFILFLIPGMPKDLLTYIVPLTPIRPAEFFVLSTIARAPSIFAMTFVIDAFSNGNFVSCIIVAVIFGGMGIIGILFNMKIVALVDSVIDRMHDLQDERAKRAGSDDKQKKD